MKNIYKIILLAFAISSFGISIAQVPVPSTELETESVVYVGATAHIGNGTLIENSAVAFSAGKLTYVGPASEFRETGYEKRDASGKHIYPGFILAGTSIGLQEVSSIRAMSDDMEVGNLNPNVRAQIAFNTDSEFIPTFRFNGILTAESTPFGGLISGTSAIMKMDGWNWKDATVKGNAAIHINWPQKMVRTFDFNTFTRSFGPNKNYNAQVEEIEKLFSDAISYGKLSEKPENLKLEALQGLFDGNLVLVIHSEMAKSVIEGVMFAQKLGIDNIAVASGDEMLFIADFLKKNNIPVLAPTVHSTPNRTDDDYDLPYKLASELSKRGVDVSLGLSGNSMLGHARNLPFYAGTAVAHGISKEDALKMLTLNPAQLLNIDKELGTLEVGKRATFFISEGDVFDMKTSIIQNAFIDGRETSLYGRQQELFDRYSERYGHTK